MEYCDLGKYFFPIMEKVNLEKGDTNSGISRQCLRSQKQAGHSVSETEENSEMPRGKQGLKPSDQEQHLPPKGMDMDKLLNYIKESQEKSEKALMKAIEGSKKEINKNMESMVV